MVNRYCSCCYHMAGNPNGAANFFRSHFVPEKWELSYFKLGECMGVTLAGRCMACRGELEETIPIPKGLAGDDLLKAIYDTVQTAHPYDKISGHIGYYGDCEERSLFYTSRDNRSQRQRSKEFLEMFNDYDREQARVNYGGSEGIYIDCYLRGKFDESGRSVLHVGTLKTLRRDLEALQIMGELCGTLTFYVDRYVNQNLHRYTPKDQLEREYERMRSEARKAGGVDHE